MKRVKRDLTTRWKKIAEAKRACWEFREQGYDIEDCSNLVGASPSTINRWQKEDTQFASDMTSAWARYKGRLIKKVENKDPKYLLQNDFSDRFKKDKEIEQPQNTAVFIGYDKLAQQLAEFLSGSNSDTNSITPPQEAERIEARGTNRTS